MLFYHLSIYNFIIYYFVIYYFIILIYRRKGVPFQRSKPRP